MARTRSDFLTRAPVLSHGGDTDEDDFDDDGSLHSPRHYTLPLSKQSSTETGLRESCFSDSDMVTGVVKTLALSGFFSSHLFSSLTFSELLQQRVLEP